jgi:antagonist of KipI
MNAFRVLKPGLFTTVQDLGRHSYLRYGVPISGAMDTFSLTAANLLVANNPHEAGLETTLIGPELEALAGICIAVTGGKASPKVNGSNVPMWHSIDVQKGDVLSFGKMESGCRAYLAVRGGIDVPPVLGSRSTYVRGGFGGLDGRPLRTGDVIKVFASQPIGAERCMPKELVPQFSSDYRVCAILGPQADMFSEEGQKILFSSRYKVTSEADRMGYRLEGQTVQHEAEADIVSDPLLPGAVQIPGSGKPILVMQDAQTTGGYPKIAVVISSDLPLLGQAKPGGAIGFSRVTLKEAQERLRQHNVLLNDLSKRLPKNQ